MSNQADDANKFMRAKIGREVDAAAAAATGKRLIEGGDPAEPDSKPWVELLGTGRQLREFAKEVGAILADEAIFRRDNYPVVVNRETGALDVIDAELFRSLAEEYIVFYKLKQVKVGRGEVGYEKEPTTMTKDCAAGCLKAHPFLYELRRIDRVNLVRMPSMRRNGRIELLQEGYDAESRTYTMTSDVKIDEKLDPVAARVMLRDYLREFPFTDDRSRAVAICMMVALYGVGLQELTANRMGGVYIANSPRSGKSLLAQFAISPCYGLAEGQTLAGRDELRKTLDAAAMQGAPYLFFDNLTGNIASELLEAYMTTPVWTGRVMGTNTKMFKAAKGTVVLITGNNLTLSPDINERVLMCRLNVEEADPQDRKIERIIDPQYLARPQVRSDLLSAQWALIRAWDEATPSRPRASRRIAGFAEWCDIFGGIVEFNGFGNPLEKPKDDESPNNKEVDKKVMVSALAENIDEGKKMKEFTFQEVVNCCYHNTCFDWMLDGTVLKEDGREDSFQCRKPSASALGKMFAEMGGQVYRLADGRRVRFGKRGKNRHRRYQVEFLH